MSRVRTSQTAKQVGNVTVVKSSTVAGMRQMRCTKCGQMATPTRDSAGNPIYVCTACGQRFGVKKL